MISISRGPSRHERDKRTHAIVSSRGDFEARRGSLTVRAPSVYHARRPRCRENPLRHLDGGIEGGRPQRTLRIGHPVLVVDHQHAGMRAESRALPHPLGLVVRQSLLDQRAELFELGDIL